MKNKGFTLIELIGSIIILTVIALVTFPAILGLLTTSEEKINNSKMRLIERAAKEYVEDHVNDYPRNLSAPVKTIPVMTLINQGYVSDNSISEKDTKVRGGCVEVKVISTEIDAEEIISYDFKFTETC